MIATLAVSSHLVVDCFYMLSAFFIANRCFEIMELKGDVLSKTDVLKIYARKFFRLAPAYYSLWFVLWAIYPMAGDGGPLWHNTEINFETCKDDFIPTLFFLGNIYPKR